MRLNVTSHKGTEESDSSVKNVRELNVREAIILKAPLEKPPTTWIVNGENPPKAMTPPFDPCAMLSSLLKSSATEDREKKC